MSKLYMHEASACVSRDGLESGDDLLPEPVMTKIIVI